MVDIIYATVGIVIAIVGVALLGLYSCLRAASDVDDVVEKKEDDYYNDICPICGKRFRWLNTDSQENTDAK